LSEEDIMRVPLTCPECHRAVRLQGAHVAVLRGAAPPLFGFVCPACRAAMLTETTAIEVLLFKSAGASVAGPQEPAYPQRRALPPLTYDDLLDFHLLLADDLRTADVLSHLGTPLDPDEKAGFRV
jgi:hypothetical protein